jgi:hypothetical protein
MNAIAAPVRTENLLDVLREKYNFTVDKFQLSSPFGETPMYGLFRSDTHELVNTKSVSGRYVPHTTDEVAAIVEATQSVFENCKATFNFRNGHYVTIEPTREDRVAIYGTADNIFPRLNIFAGYDGQAFKTWMGWFRDLCLNMSRMKSVKSTQSSIHHSGGLRSRMNELIDKFYQLKDSWSDLTGTILQMESVQVQLGDFLRSVYGEPAESGRGATMHQNRTEKIFKRILDERLRSGRPQLDGNYHVSAWEAYNAVQGYVQHDASRRGNATAFDRLLLADNDASVDRAESLAFQAILAA